MPVLGNVAPSIAHFVSLEVGLIHTPPRISSLAPVRHGAAITVFRVEPIVDVAMKIGGAVEPRAGADENTAAEPFRTVVAGRRTAVRSYVVITVGAVRSDTDTDADLSVRNRDGKRKTRC